MQTGGGGGGWLEECIVNSMLYMYFCKLELNLGFIKEFPWNKYNYTGINKDFYFMLL